MERALLNLKEIKQFATECAKELRGGEVIALIGELGAGKTTFTKELLKAKGVRKRITSPTFGLIAEYKVGKKDFYHVDLYRIGSLKEFTALGISQTWQQPNSTYIIEWADKISRILPKGTIIIRFSHSSESNPNQRKISISTK